MILSFFVPESPKYLHARGKYKELALYINESARQNGINFKIEENIGLFNKYNSTRSENKDIETQNDNAEYSIWNDLKQIKILTNFFFAV